MPTERIRLLVELEIQDGKFADFEGVAKQLVAVSEQEPGTLNFKFYLSGDRRRGWWRAVPIRLRLQRTFRARQYSNSFRNCFSSVLPKAWSSTEIPARCNQYGGWS